MERAPRANPHDKYICTFYPGRLQDGTFVDGFDYCNWRIPDEATYGEFFICFVGQHEIGDGNIFFPIPIILSIFFFSETERDHIQCFIKTQRRVRYQQITDRLGLRPDQVHYKPVYRTPEKAWDYCTDKKPTSQLADGEDDSDEESVAARHGCNFWQFGQRPLDGRSRGGRGQRFEVEPLFNAIRAGKSDFDILLDPELGRVAFLHSSSYRWAKQVLTAPRNLASEWQQRDVCVFYGAAGTGKSSEVRRLCERLGRSLWVAPVGTAGAW